MSIAQVEWRIFPTTSPLPSTPSSQQCYHYDDGDDVFIRPKSNNQFGKYGTVKSSCCTEEVQQVRQLEGGQSNDKRRVTVELQSSGGDKNATYQATFRPNRLMKRYRPCYSNSSSDRANDDNKIQILVTAKTTHYRNLAASQLDKNDSILEIGCSNGQCSILILKYGGDFIGYDTSKKMIEDAVNNETIQKLIADRNRRMVLAEKNKDQGGQKSEENTKEKMDENGNNNDNDSNGQGGNNGNCYFYTIDPFQDPKKAGKIATQNQSTNVVFIDIGGNREIEGVLRMIHWSRELLLSSKKLGQRDMLIVVKSEQLVERLEKEATISNENRDDINSVGPLPPKRKKINPTDIPITINLKSGLIHNCEEWFQTERLLLEGDYEKDSSSIRLLPSKQCQSETSIPTKSKKPSGPPKYSHPLKAPMSLCPIDGKTPICRYFNYHKAGCRKGEKCEFDHIHCHWCKRKGHIALDCQKFSI